jgi:hypothetical protein
MDYTDYNLVALERMVAYMHLDMVMPNHLKYRLRNKSFFFLSVIFFIPVVVGGGPPDGGADGCCACGYGGAALDAYGLLAKEIKWK